LLENEFFKAPKERRFAHPEYNSADLGTKALQALWKDSGVNPEEIDLILYSAAITDYVNIGIGPDIQYRSGAKNARVLSIDTGCSSFLSMLNIADKFLQAEQYKKIAIVTATNFVSRLEDFQKSPRSWVLGDGATATLVERGPSCILASNEASHGDNYGLMVCRPRNAQNEPQDYWDTNAGGLQVEFSPDMVDRLKANAINLVSDSVKKSIHEAGLTNSDISFLITHQPNIGLMEKWRATIDIKAPRVFDTFQKYGNLFQGSIPTTLSEGLKTGVLKHGDVLAVGTFSNGGDFVSSMVMKL
jgi:3-oxoacyl-[acyl-carrier-protein] synthase-3